VRDSFKKDDDDDDDPGMAEFLRKKNELKM
jgi:hypothetical protein